MKKKLLTITILFLIVFATSFSLVQANGGAAEIQRSVCSGGGGTVSGGSVSLSGTLGQPITGSSSDGQVTIQSGFWPGLEGVTQLLCYFPLVFK